MDHFRLAWWTALANKNGRGHREEIGEGGTHVDMGGQKGC